MSRQPDPYNLKVVRVDFLTNGKVLLMCTYRDFKHRELPLVLERDEARRIAVQLIEAGCDGANYVEQQEQFERNRHLGLASI